MEINWLATALAFAVGMVVAGVWYGKVFTTVWSTLAGVAPEDSKQARKRNMGLLLLANAVTALGLAVGIEITSQALRDDSVWLALLVGFTAWSTLSATTLLQHNAFELKPPQLTLINSAYQLVLFLAMALVIGAM